MMASTNPFRYSAPVGPEDLVDREEAAGALLDAAHEGNNARLSAPRRYGKTSLLRFVLAEAERTGMIGVYVDFFGVVSLADVAERIERAYGRSLRGPLASWFDGLRRSLRTSVQVGVPGASVGAELDRRQAAPLLERLALPRRIAERSGRRVLVVFDEFQGILTAGDAVDATIRSEIQHHADVASYVFAGSQVGMMEQLFADRRRAFFAQARAIPLPPLPPEPTAGFVADRFSSTGRDVGHALGALLDAARGHPQRTVLLAHHLWEATEPGTSADEALFTLVFDRVLEEVADELRGTWSRLSASQRRTLAVLAAQGRPYARRSEVAGSKGGAVRAALGALASVGEIVKDPSAVGGWRLVDPLLAEWVRRGRPSA